MININVNDVFRGYNVSKRSGDIKYIVVHYCGAEGTARNNIDYFSGGNRHASADFFVGHSGEIWQYNPDIEGQYTWHCGGGRQTMHGGDFFMICTNANSIGIEMCCHEIGNDVWKFEEETVKACAELVQYLMNKYDIPIERVIRHYDVTGKYCPGVPGWIPPIDGESKWLQFKQHITSGTVQVTTSLTKIAGTAEASLEQMSAYIQKVNPDIPDSVIEMIPFYISEGKEEGIRGDIAFAQSCLETGNFKFEGSAVTLEQNNFCGMGVTKTGMRGNSFISAQMGIRAQIQHLKAYASQEALKQTCIDPRFTYVVRGCAPYVEWLGIQENPAGYGWAAGADYGKNILRILKAILETCGGCDSCSVETDSSSEGSAYMFSTKTIKKGSTGADVVLLQKLLLADGYTGMGGRALAIDGDFGENTDKAVKEYQSKHEGLEVDGIAGPATWESILGI